MVKSVVKAVEGIDEPDWTPIDYPAEGEAEVAECAYKGRDARSSLTAGRGRLWRE